MATEARKTRGERRSRKLTLLPSRYEVGEEIGRGGMGVVYRAYDPALDRPVAIKVLGVGIDRPSALARLRREAISAARLRHPNIALLYEFEQSDDQALLVMEYIDGPSLRQQLDRGRLAPERALRVLEQIASALDYAHGMGIVHRDVKPSNILLGPDDHAVLIDFGLADGAEDATLTREGGLLGTPHYMAPEQARGQGADARSDLYALGAVAYELLTGAAPFEGRSSAAVVHAQIYELPPPPCERDPSVPQAASNVLLRALAKSPHDRYPSAMAFVAALRATLLRPQPRPRRRGLALLAGLTLALILAAAALASAQRGARPDTQARTPLSGVPLPQRVVWSFASDRVGGPPPLLIDSTLVVGMLDGTLAGIDLNSGEERWRKASPVGMYGPPAVGPGLVFVGNSEGEVSALSPESGGLIWRTPVVGAVHGAPVFAANTLLVTTAKGYVYLLQPGSGLIVWGRPLDGELGQATAAEGLLFVPAGERLYALDAANGMLRWQHELGSTITTQPIATGGMVLVGTTRGELYALDAGGRARWRYRAAGAIEAAPTPFGEQLLLADRSGALTMLAVGDGTVLWNSRLDATPAGSPSVANGRVVVGALDGTLAVFDAGDGALLGSYRLPATPSGSPALGQGLIVVRADKIYALGEQ
jgi:eukaryotic-like serine/threonine-protein kinase